MELLATILIVAVTLIISNTLDFLVVGVIFLLGILVGCLIKKAMEHITLWF